MVPLALALLLALVAVSAEESVAPDAPLVYTLQLSEAKKAPLRATLLDLQFGSTYGTNVCPGTLFSVGAAYELFSDMLRQDLLFLGGQQACSEPCQDGAKTPIKHAHKRRARSETHDPNVA